LWKGKTPYFTQSERKSSSLELLSSKKSYSPVYLPTSSASYQKQIRKKYYIHPLILSPLSQVNLFSFLFKVFLAFGVWFLSFYKTYIHTLHNPLPVCLSSAIFCLSVCLSHCIYIRGFFSVSCFVVHCSLAIIVLIIIEVFGEAFRTLRKYETFPHLQLFSFLQHTLTFYSSSLHIIASLLSYTYIHSLHTFTFTPQRYFSQIFSFYFSMSSYFL
jgi:hypothetical protein